MSETVLENRNENTENIDQKALELAQDFRRLSAFYVFSGK